MTANSNPVPNKMSNANLANQITIGRIILIPVFVSLMITYGNSTSANAESLRIWAVAIFTIAVLTDAVDGFIARTRGLKTPLGTFLDPLADKLLLTTSIVILTLPNPKLGYQLPVWFAVLAISRDVFITGGALLIHVLTGSVRIVPSILGKATTVLQMLTIAWILLKLPSAYLWVYASALLTVISGFGYLFFGNKQINTTPKS
jgi:cardiolipin synthase